MLEIPTGTAAKFGNDDITVTQQINIEIYV